ncbi:TPA: hypothetical protein N0F65_009878, partial [Lagenidium giganteum]
QNSSLSNASNASTASASAPSSSAPSGAVVAAAAGGDDEKLPPGWTRKESKTQKRFYYVSPTGKTQWVRPQIKPAARQYNWHLEIEIEFGEGRLGVGLREVSQVDAIPYAQFQAVVDDLPKVNGKPGPAEIYNWSVKPEKRLKIGMRLTAIDGQCLAGYTYKEVADKLKKSSRPLKIKFADADLGTVEDNPNVVIESEEKGKQENSQSPYLLQKQEYTRVVVMSELHSEMWNIENHKLSRSLAVLKAKWDTVSKEFDALNKQRVDLKKENDKLQQDKDKFETMIKHLKLQEIKAMDNPEVAKSAELTKRNQTLTDDIARMSSGNKKLRKERMELQTTLDELESSLSKMGKQDEEEEGKKDGDDDFFGIDPSATPAEQLAALRKKLRFMEDELTKEQKKAAKVEKEMEQLNRHLGSLSGGSASVSSTTSTASSSGSVSGSSSSRSRDDKDRPHTSSSSRNLHSHKSPEMLELESRIHELRKKQRAVVDQLAKAAQAGDQELAKECQKKRHAIKDELRSAQDALNRLKGHDSSDSLSKKSSASTSTSSSGQSSKIISASELAAAQSQSTSSSSRSKGDSGMPTLSGYLEKGPTEWSERGMIGSMKTMRGARERWCEITSDGRLKYYKRRGDPVVRGEIDLSDKTFEVACEDMQRGTEFTLCTNTQQSHFFAKTNQEMVTWVKTLRAANAYLQQNARLDALAGKADAADKRSGTSNGAPHEEEEFYGRATLGF